MAVKNTNQSLSWTIQNSSDLYGIDRWGKGYFTINEKGNIGICPNGSKNKSHDLMELLDELESRKLKFPLLISCLLYTSPSPRDRTRSRMPSSA